MLLVDVDEVVGSRVERLCKRLAPMADVRTVHLLAHASSMGSGTSCDMYRWGSSTEL